MDPADHLVPPGRQPATPVARAAGGLAFTCNGVDLVARPDGSLWWPRERLLAVADLHLEKGSWYGMRTGQLLPPYDTRATLSRLAQAIEQTQPSIVLCVGDSFHDGEAASRVDAADAGEIKRLIGAARDWIWITGNHDPAPPRQWGGQASVELALGSLVFRHQALSLPLTDTAGEVSGHYHPVASLVVRGRGLRRRCFLTDGTRLILPSYGAYTGGLNARDDAVARIFDGPYDALAIGTASVHRLPVEALRRDAELMAAK
ncbi:MAG: ligase-associated DNA damage response endonuclease PdeM [Alphaproteobacteria bacterium]|nr:ligase-associated DNA damage response endonuclease PdeM [Alphaproteobacteria bacterium]